MKEIISLLENIRIPVWVVIILAFTIILLGSPVIAKLIDLFSNRKKKDRKKQINPKDILNHPYFDFISYCLNIRIRQLDFGTDFKNNVFHDLLYIRYKIFNDNLKEYVTQYISSDIPSNIFKTKITFILYDSINECEAEWRNLGIPDIDYIINKFSRWHSITVEFIQKYTQKTLESQIYDSDIERLNAILDLYTTAFEVTLLDVESGLRRINGRFRNLHYKSRIFQNA